ncbi:hypothetical protein KSP40_PGU000598 [Platanthera guangdongensis]|uniref:Uncharacterized protein n=1 Tax=Platanthera guangdongensis TaxID=2320717 RepID=A0ABR2M8M3_9ASPA
MAYCYGRQDPSVFDALTASPLSYPVLFILLTVFLLLSVSCFFFYEEMLESADEQMSVALLLTPPRPAPLSPPPRFLGFPLRRKKLRRNQLRRTATCRRTANGELRRDVGGIPAFFRNRICVI